MFYRFASVAAVCVVLTACSGSDEAKMAKVMPNETATTAASEPVPAVATQAAPVTQPAVSAPVNTPPIDPATCPYSLADLNQGLGLSLSIVNAVEVPFAGGTQLSCQYTGEQSATVMVNKLAMQDPKMLEGMEQFLAGSLESIPNDPDQAQWQTSDSGLHDLTLHYVRAGNSIDVRLMGVDENDWSTVKQKLVELHRVP